MKHMSVKPGDENCATVGINKILAVPQWSVFIISNQSMQLKILSYQLEEISSILATTQVISMAFLDYSEEIIIGSIGCIQIWTVKMMTEK